MHRLDRPSLPPTEALIAFRLARDLGSYAAAARAEGVNHATILRRVATLEAWLGTQVLQRAGRGVALTPAGQRFASVADRAIVLLEDAADRWRPAHAPARIALSVLPAFARLHLMPVMAKLLRPDRGRPRWQVEVSVSHRPVALGDGRHDVAVRYGKGGWEDVTPRPLPEEPLIPAVHRDLLDEAQLDPAVISRMPLIHDSNSADWQRWFVTRGIDYRPKATDIRLEDYDLAFDAACRGLGWLLLRCTGEPVPEPLAVFDDVTLPNPRRHWIVTADDEERPAVLAFADALHTALTERSEFKANR